MEAVHILAGTEGEVANTSTPVFVITDKTLRSIEKLVENLKKLGIKDVNGELVNDEEEASYEYISSQRCHPPHILNAPSS